MNFDLQLLDAAKMRDLLNRFAGLSLLSTALMTALPSTSMAQWPQFRGPHGDGVVAGPLPTQWSQDESVQWRTELPGEGWSSPVVAGGTVYLTAAIKREEPATEKTAEEEEDAPRKPKPAAYDLSVLMVDEATGALTKRIDLFVQSTQAARIHKKNSHASPTPVIDGQRLYVHFGHQGTACLDLAGNVIWENDSLGYKPVHGNGGTPVVVGDRMIFSRDGAKISEVTALDTKTGQIAWQCQRDVEAPRHFSFCTPAVFEVAGKQQLVLPGSNVVQGIEPKTGQEIWRVQYEGYSVVPRPIYHAGLVFVSTGYDRASLLAIDPTGEGDVTDSHVVWQTDTSIAKTPSMIGYKGKIYQLSDNGIAVCFDAKTGDMEWKERIGGNFSTSLLLAGDHLYMTSEAGVTTVMNIAGEPEEVAENELNERTLASFAVSHGGLLVRTADALYRIQ